LWKHKAEAVAGRYLEGGDNATRGSVRRTAGNTAPPETDPPGAHILGAASLESLGTRRKTAWGTGEDEKPLPLTVGENLCRRPKPKGVTGMKQGRNGMERNKASRG